MSMSRWLDDIGVQDHCDSDSDDDDDIGGDNGGDDDGDVQGACLPQHVNLPCIATSQSKLTEGKNH